MISEVKKFWVFAGIFILDDKRCIQKLEKLREEYRNVLKNAGVSSNQEKEQVYSLKLEMLFDIAQGWIFEMVDNNTKDFLVDRRTNRKFHFNFSANHHLK